MAYVVFLVLLALTLPAAHIIGSIVARASRVESGHIREAMPSLPAAPPYQGKAERRWDKRITKLEKLLIARFKDGAQNIEAHELAAQLGEEPMVVDAVLTRLREEIPCRMRIMQSGKIYHDFEASDIAELKAQRRRSWPRQLFLSALAAMANIGAAWPALSVAAIAFAGLTGMATAGEGETLVVGVMGLVAASALILVTFIGGFVAQLLFTPFRGPALGDVKHGEERPQRTISNSTADDIVFWTWIDASHTPTHSFYGSGYSSGSSSSSGFDLDIDGDAGEGVLILIVAALLIAILAAAVSVIWIWLRGIWRALRRLDEPQTGISPTLWVRTADVIDKWERYIPTNDLVIRTLHGLKRYFDHRRPVDDDLAARVLILAKSNGGIASSLDIMLQEGLDDTEANEVGSRLAGMLGGRIMVSDDGELAFAFPESLLGKVVSTPDDDMWAEYIEFDHLGEPRRRQNQEAKNVPVNIVGLTKGHLLANDRLVAGTYIMSAMGAGLGAMLFGGPIGYALLGALIFMMCLAMALGTATLNASARYTAREAAAQGIRRDIRRATFKRVKRALTKGQESVSFERFESQLYNIFSNAWRGLEENMIKREIRAVIIDLNLDLSQNPAHAGQEIYDLSKLRHRMNSAKQLEAVYDGDAVMFEFDEDEEDTVVFDTKVEHDHVTVLGRA